MNQERMKEIFNQIKKVKVAVCGDFCLDIYWELDPAGSEISVETGLLAQAVKKQRYQPGGAGNIVANMAALEPAKISAVGIIGSDLFGKEILSLLLNLGVNEENLILQRNDFDTYAYCKRYLNGEELERIDFGFFNKRSQDTDEELLSRLPRILQEHDAFVFNQQIPGSVANDFFIERMNEIFQDFQGKVIIVDSRHYAGRFRNVILKMNELELAQLSNYALAPDQRLTSSEIRTLAKKVFEKNQRPIFITRGEKGIAAFDGEKFAEIPGIVIYGEYDAVGAGDTVVSALACALAAGAGLKEAAELANFAAAVTVKKVRQTGTATSEEILQVAGEANLIYQPDLAENIEMAQYLPDSNIEICCHKSVIARAKIHHIVFDHDGTISVLRQGWEKIMERTMVAAILGDQTDFLDEQAKNRIREIVREYIEESKGIQTILQMETLVEMVKRFGFVPKNKIKSKLEYKEIYNRELLKIVNQRIELLQKRELMPEDFIIKGAVPFLEKLRELGLTLYLASGTDKEDVAEEAKVLGYADLFNGGIFGSMNDVKKYSKKLVIQKILDENNLQGNELAVFGDGPVEIRECRRHEGIAIGVASDEIQRQGLNLEKRTRLIKAGAHLIIPDFLEWERIVGLFW